VAAGGAILQPRHGIQEYAGRRDVQYDPIRGEKCGWLGRLRRSRDREKCEWLRLVRRAATGAQFMRREIIHTDEIRDLGIVIA
jgi:hypothetical protein